ncbi:hypothetical protein [Candidatus Jettenia sp. AMX1]|nr:hypothetical protein [Candidatus Jettenia sp. AMX1]MDN3510335.1 hypothetical protein [Candidatus Jettenia sp.]
MWENKDMIVTREMLVNMLIDYINRRIDTSNLISWAEDMMREADFEDQYFELLRDITARIGLADVREFGLYWDDCCDYLHKLGYRVKIEILEIS